MNHGSLDREGRQVTCKSRFTENSKQEPRIGRLGKPEMEFPLDKVPALRALQRAAREEKVEIVEEHERQHPRKVRSQPFRFYVKVILQRQIPKACLFQLSANERIKRASKLGIEGCDRIRVLQKHPIFTGIRAAASLAIQWSPVRPCVALIAASFSVSFSKSRFRRSFSSGALPDCVSHADSRPGARAPAAGPPRSLLLRP